MFYDERMCIASSIRIEISGALRESVLRVVKSRGAFGMSPYIMYGVGGL